MVVPKRILIATFSLWLKGKRTPINGMVEPMLSYFLPEKCKVDLIDGLHPGSSDVITRFEYYSSENSSPEVKISLISRLMKPFLQLSNTNATQIIFKLRDILTPLELVLRRKTRYDLFIGLECIYTSVGIFLKKLGLVKTVVYYVSDYSPQRWGQSWFTKLYLRLDRFCCYHSDYIWDVSKAFQPARIQAGLASSRSAPVIHVPNALFKDQICPLKESALQAYSLVFAGTLNIYNGPDLAVEAMPFVLKKFPKAILHIYGTNGSDQARVTARMEKLHIKNAVIFHGLISNAITLSQTINAYMIGLAPYINRKDSHRSFGDATKLRLYCGAGLPILTTHVPPLGKELQAFGACIQVNDNPQELSNAIIRVLSSAPIHRAMRLKAMAYAKHNTWDVTYGNAFAQMISS